MEGFFEFLRDAGGWGVASVTATLLSSVIGVWNYSHNSPVPGTVAVCLTVPLFWVGAYVAWLKKRKELIVALASLKATFPNVVVEIISAYILPRKNSADCFIQARFHNVIPNTRARIIGYEFCLIIADKAYCTREPSDPADYGLGRIEWDEDDRPPSQYITDVTPLRCLRRSLARPGVEPLIDGVPEDGWLRFEIAALPDWPSEETVVGQEDVMDDEDGWIQQEITETDYFSSTVTAITLRVEDSYHAWTEDKKPSPLGSPDFGIKALATYTK